MKEIADIRYIGELRCECTHSPSDQTIETDAPVDNNGLGQAFSPTDLLATSLASCMITVMGIAATKNAWAFECSAKVYKEMKSSPRRVGKVRVELNMPRAVSEEIQNKLEDIALNCPVALSLSEEIEQEVVFNYLDKTQ